MGRIKTEGKIITELPKYKEGKQKNKINWEECKNKYITIEYIGKQFKVFIYDVIKKKVGNQDRLYTYLMTDFEGFRLEGGIRCSSFLKGQFDGILFNYKPSIKRYTVKDKGEYIEVNLGFGKYKDMYWIMDNNNKSYELLNSNYYSISKDGQTYYVDTIHRDIKGINNKKYDKWVIDHLNGNGLDNRNENLIITDNYGNLCNITKAKGYHKTKSNTYQVTLMKNYPYEVLYRNKPRQATFKTEEEAIEEVEYRRNYVLNHRFKFKTKEELDEYLKGEDSIEKV